MTPAGHPVEPGAHGLLAGRTVLLTAAAGTGIGYATARRCAQEGARVAISDRHERRLAGAADMLAEAVGRRPLTVPCDVTVEAQVQAMVDEVVGAYGQVDVLVNNAGLGGTTTVTAMSDDEWHRVLDVNLTGTFRCTRAALRHMMPRGRGVIVNNASVLGWRAQPGQAHYAAAKAAVMAFTRCTALEAAASGVRVNAVAPSLAMHPHLSQVTDEGLLATLVEREPLGRAAEPWEVANVIVFLASDYASYLVGEVLSVSSQHP